MSLLVTQQTEHMQRVDVPGLRLQQFGVYDSSAREVTTAMKLQSALEQVLRRHGAIR